MKRNLKRLVLALIISTSCFFGTVVWFNSGVEGGIGGDRKPVAQLSESQNEVQRKQQERVIWENITINEELYPGEAIRTAANAEAKIKLIKSGTVIHLEPDSLVVLEENDRGLSLDFLQGNLLVQNGGSGDGSDVTLKAGKGEIKLGSADMSLSSGKNGNVNLEVLKGQAQFTKDGKAVALNQDGTAMLGQDGLSISKDLVYITAPRGGDKVLLNLVRGEKLAVGFKPLPAGYKVSAEWGQKREDLKPSGDAVEGETGKLSLGAKAGTWYLRLTAKSDNPQMPPLASSTLRLEIAPKSAPTLISPNLEKPAQKESADAKAKFKWVTPNAYESQVVEVASDAQFKNKKFSQNLDGKSSELEADLADGTYFWRVTGFLKNNGKLEGLTSAPAKFTALSRWEIKPPVLTYPANQQYLSYSDAQKSGVNFKWQNPGGVERFSVQAQRKGDKGFEDVYEKEVETTNAKFPAPKPGVYQWTVTSLDSKGGPGKESTKFTFTVEEMPRLEWAQQPNEYDFPTPTPSLSAKWKPMVTPPANYRYKVTPKAGGEGEWHTTKQTVFDIPVPSEGEYEAVVEAVNAKGQTVAQTETRTFKVKRRPLLPAPVWVQNTPETLKSDAKGNLSFGWEEVEGAQHYLMILENEDGKVVDQKEVTRTTASLARLKPGQYKVKLKSVDSLKRAGLESKPKPVVVPSLSDIRAPKIKQMKVK